MPETDPPDPGDMEFKDAAGQTDAGDSVAEEATEDEVLDIVTAGSEPRTFADTARQGANPKPAKSDAPAPKSADAQPDEADPHVDKQLDHGLKETFPASDPVSINPGAD
jgi:hypothetical protein